MIPALFTLAILVTAALARCPPMDNFRSVLDASYSARIMDGFKSALQSSDQKFYELEDIFQGNTSFIEAMQELANVNTRRHWLSTNDESKEAWAPLEDLILEAMHTGGISTWDLVDNVCAGAGTSYPNGGTVTCNCLEELDNTSVTIGKDGMDDLFNGCAPKICTCDQEEGKKTFVLRDLIFKLNNCVRG